MNLLLYTNITPNKDNTHYLFSNFSDYKTALSSHLFKTVVLTDYRITSGVIKVKIDETLTLANYKNVTYAINENDNMCYLIKSSVVISGFIIYECNVDYWGSYIANADISHINVLRCNRNIDIGIYDNIKATKNNNEVHFDIPNGEYVVDTSTTPQTEYKDNYKFENVYIVFCLTYNIEQTSYGATSATGMFAMNLKTIYDRYISNFPNGIYENPLNIARAWVSGIYGVSGSNQYGHSVTLDAKVTKAYIMPKDLLGIRIYSTPIIEVVTKSLYGDFDTNDPLGVFEVTNYKRVKDFYININPNYNYYVGTVNKGLKITRDTSGSILIRYQSIINNNDIQVIVKQGDNQQNISSEFEIDLTMNDGDITNLTGIKQALKSGLTVIQGVSSGNYLSMGMQLAGTSIDLIGNHYYGKQEGNGDGIVTFLKTGNASIGLGLYYPYAYITCESITDEQTNARQKGAFYDCYVSTLASIFNFSFIGTGSNNDDTYVKANLCIAGIPAQAINEIITKFKNGVYLKKL